MSKAKSSKPAAKHAVKPSVQPTARSSTQAAQAEHTTAAFLREVDEAMRVERWQTLWKKSKLPLFAGVGSLIAASAAWQAYQSWQTYQDRSTATRWAELAELPSEADLAGALPAFVAESAYGYKALGLMAQAASARDDTAKISAYRALQADTTLPEWLRAFGQLNAALVMLNTDNEGARAELALLAKTEIGTPPLPTAPIAMELLALDAMQRGDKAAARGYTDRLLQLPEQGGLITPALRDRALERLGALSS